ncbi:MAG: hypothetical protein J1E41_05415 [Ruminococcus sp.]|nr:hypothetical protein [Ruminococcus sp.]
MNYKEMKAKHQKEYNEFPLGAAFSNKQFDEMMEKWGLNSNSKTDINKIISIGFGCYIKKEDKDGFHEMNRRHKQEVEDAILADTSGEGFIMEMFYSELVNHEYGYVYDQAIEDTLEALGYTTDEINADERLLTGLNLAKRKVMEDCSL